MLTTFDDGSYLSEIVASGDRRRRSHPIQVCVIEYTLADRLDATVYRLITTLADAKAAPAAELAALYVSGGRSRPPWTRSKPTRAAPAWFCAPSTPPASNRKSSASCWSTTRCGT